MRATVADLARWQVGQVVWVVRLARKRQGACPPELGWLHDTALDLHPKVNYDYKWWRKGWCSSALLPKLIHSDFQSLTELMSARLTIGRFPIAALRRSRHTGEMYYATGEEGDWMPESYLFATAREARVERDRIKRMLARWLEDKL